MRATAAKLVDAEITDDNDLWYPEERTPVDGWLREHGWDVSTATFAELMARYGRTIPPGRRKRCRPPSTCPRSGGTPDRTDRRLTPVQQSCRKSLKRTNGRGDGYRFPSSIAARSRPRQGCFPHSLLMAAIASTGT